MGLVGANLPNEIDPIWGPVGLVLAMPVTLMLVVLGRHIPAFEIFDVLLGDRPALSPAETFYQRVLAGNVEEAIEQAEGCLETMSMANYFDDVMLGGMRLAAADFDRGAVDRQALASARDAILEVLEALQEYPDIAMPDADLGPTQALAEDQTGACETPKYRSVLCVAGRGPLDPAVARMTAQMLRRAGCSVQEQVRMPGRLDDPSKLAIGGADFVCMLGLFDDRGYRRMERLAKTLGAKASGITILIGLARTLDMLAKPVADGPIPSLDQLCQTVCGTEQAPQVAAEIGLNVAEKPAFVTSNVDR